MFLGDFLGKDDTVYEFPGLLVGEVDSLIQLEANPAHECNPNFEAVLKGNANNYYCRGNVAELVRYCYIPEAEVYCSWVRDGLRNGVQGRWKRPAYFEAKSEEIQKRFAGYIEKVTHGKDPNKTRIVLE